MSDEMDEIWSLYADDGAQALDAMETALLALDPDDGASDDGAPDAATIAGLFRAIHTFKGNARVLGLGVIESCAHLAEDLIGLVRDEGKPFDRAMHRLLVETGDALRQMLEISAASRQDADPALCADLLARLRQKVETTRSGAVDEAGAGDAGPDAPDRSRAPDAEGGESAAPDAAASVSDAPSQAVTPVAVDMAYLAIFHDMAEAALATCAAADDAASRRALADLAHAARQLGLAEWLSLLDPLPSPLSPDALAALTAAMRALLDRGDAAPPPTAPAVAEADAPALAADGRPGSGGGPAPDDFLTRIEGPLSAIARHAIDLSVAERPDPERLAEAVALVVAEAAARGYPRIADTCDLILAAGTPATLRRAELQLYEELASVEVIERGAASAQGPASILAGWCADHVFDTLDEMGATLDRLKRAESGDAATRALSRLTRLIHHACRFYGLDTAAQLAMSLLDLFERGQTSGRPADAILLRIAQGFVTTLELVFDALREGEVPDTTRLEQLFAEASEISFTASGLLTATAVERRLGLPPEFHRVLSPDSVAAASQALAEGLGFWILRADVNDDEQIAERLFGFIGAGAIRAITNVTVFRGRDTLFDFLIASALSEADLAEALALMDPGGGRLTLMRRLEVAAGPEDGAPAAGGEADPGGGAGDGPADPAQSVALAGDIPIEMLERIGEIAAGQAMVHGMIGDLVEEDPSARIDEFLRASQRDSAAAAAGLRRYAEDLGRRLRALLLPETQILGQMGELQQMAADRRARPLDVVLRPLGALVSAEARNRGADVRLTVSGGELSVDVAQLETLKRVLRPLVLALTAGTPPRSPARRMHLSARRGEDRLAVTLDDSGGGAGTAAAAVDAAMREVERTGGDLRQVDLPGGGTRLHLTLPISLVVMQGMVVGVGGVRYVLPVESISGILQPEEGAIRRLSAGGGDEILRLASGAILPLHRIAPPWRDGRPEAAGRVIVTLAHFGRSVAVPVDEVVGQQLVLLRPLRGLMARLRGLTGVALLAGGEVGMVLSSAVLCGADGPDTGRPGREGPAEGMGCPRASAGPVPDWRMEPTGLR
ncbi:Hpt domain-containing protein [Frigidibacter oleivorans]|uniref:Hpt domain-containing protein n=1 Tax=Frigidibacter oleivorans TaxID=2487129 RepID=UPI000F8CDDA0|nr:Hpt domain-containing protein [Frigidibacter oleivorans]